MKALVVTPGEPAGIGPDIVLMAACRGKLMDFPYYVVADSALLKNRAEQLSLPVVLHTMEPEQSITVLPQNHLWVYHAPLKQPVLTGHPHSINAKYVLKTLEVATEACLKKQALGMVTGPVHKATICESGQVFSGHTEFLALKTKSPMTQMLFVHPAFKVALLTTHIPLKMVSTSLNQALIQQHIEMLSHGLNKYWNLTHPKIGVLGLNPHAGENGHLGSEEQQIIIPAIKACQQKGIAVLGPLSGDTAFCPKLRNSVDALLAMYHDQALAPIKALGFGEAVNMTLGLPFLRTSVDHGTAFSLAGQGTADPSSFETAFNLAANLLKDKET